MKWVGHMYDAVQQGREVWMLAAVSKHGHKLSEWVIKGGAQ
jgi:hypothetical protein